MVHAVLGGFTINAGFLILHPTSERGAEAVDGQRPKTSPPCRTLRVTMPH
jgi:hypothetical protein